MNVVYEGRRGQLIFPQWQQPPTDYTSKQCHRLVVWFFVGLNLLLLNPIKKYKYITRKKKFVNPNLI